MDRRDFLRTTAIAGMATGAAQWGSSCTQVPVPPAYNGKRLVLVKLAGGNDGLFAFFPREHDTIDAARPNLGAMSRQNAIPVYGEWYLNGQFRTLETLLGRGEMAILPFVGYPSPNTSHFKSSEIWDTGFIPGENAARSGWIGRLLDSGVLSVPGNETPAVSLAEADTIVIRGLQKQGLYWRGNEPLEWYAGDIRHWLRHHRHNQLSEQVFREYSLIQWLSDVRACSGFPSTILGEQLARIATMVQTDKPFKVFYAMQGGYDTHKSAGGKLLNLYADLNAALFSLSQSLKASGHWKDTIVLVYSEFGRTIDENANGGTDHGAAGLCLLLGDNPVVKKYANISPEIQFIEMAGERYLGHQLDFRDLYDAMIRGWLA